MIQHNEALTTHKRPLSNPITTNIPIPYGNLQILQPIHALSVLLTTSHSTSHIETISAILKRKQRCIADHPETMLGSYQKDKPL